MKHKDYRSTERKAYQKGYRAGSKKWRKILKHTSDIGLEALECLDEADELRVFWKYITTGLLGVIVILLAKLTWG